MWGGVREAKGWLSCPGVPIPLLILRYVPLAISTSLDEAILLTVSPKWPHQNLPIGGLVGSRRGWGQTCTGGRGWTGKPSWMYHYYFQVSWLGSKGTDRDW